MILTCPACGTSYAIKDGAIPLEGRRVRCAACKHSWHQNPEIAAPVDGVTTSEYVPTEEGNIPSVEVVAPPVADHSEAENEAYDVPANAAEGDSYSEVAIQEPAAAPYEAEAPETYPASDVGTEEARPVEAAPASHPLRQSMDDDFAPIGRFDEEDEPRGNRLVRVLLVILVLAALAVAAFLFLVPTEWKARAGIAGIEDSQLQVMLTTSDRQKLESGNELLAISGRIINPTDEIQAVPPIRAELRNKQSRALVYQWTIAPPARSLAPRASAAFNSAEVDIPAGGDELTVSLDETTN